MLLSTVWVYIDLGHRQIVQSHKKKVLMGWNDWKDLYISVPCFLSQGRAHLGSQEKLFSGISESCSWRGTRHWVVVSTQLFPLLHCTMNKNELSRETKTASPWVKREIFTLSCQGCLQGKLGEKMEKLLRIKWEQCAGWGLKAGIEGV